MKLKKVLMGSLIILSLLVLTIAEEPNLTEIKPNVTREIVEDYTKDLTNGNEVVSEHIAGAKYKYAKNDDIIIYTKKRSDSYCPVDFETGIRICSIPFEIVNNSGNNNLKEYSINLIGLEKYKPQLFYSIDYNIVVDVMENSTWECLWGKNKVILKGDDGENCIQLTEQYIKVSRKEFYNYQPIKDLKEVDLTKPTSILINFTTPMDDVFSYDIRVSGKTILPFVITEIILDPSTGVSTCQDLEDMNDDLTADYHLTEDIDCSGHGVFESVGGFFNGYLGTFDGKNFTINDVTMVIGEGQGHGIFAECDGCTIKDVGIVNIDITTEGEDEWRYDGGLVGVIRGSGSIYRSYTTGSIDQEDGYLSRVGGLNGDLYNGYIYDCYSNVSIAGADAIGGLVGRIYSGIVETSYAYGSLSGFWQVGGAVGNDDEQEDTGCHFVYYDTDTSGQSDSTCGAKKNTTEEMMMEENFAFDFVSVWDIVEDEVRPFFFWSVTTPTDTCTAPGSGNWEIDCSDACVWTTNFVVPANISMSGIGTLTLNSNMSFANSHKKITKYDGCRLLILTGNKIS